MYVFTQKLSSALTPTLILALSADERTRSRYRYSSSSEITDSGQVLDPNQPVETGLVQGLGPGLDVRKKDIPTHRTDIYLELPRGTTLHHGDCLGGEGHGQVLKIVSKPEPVLTVRAAALQLMRAAYHLGNRHVALEVGPDYLRLAPDPVLADMLHHLGVAVTAETMPFQPESGAYGHHH